MADEKMPVSIKLTGDKKEHEVSIDDLGPDLRRWLVAGGSINNVEGFFRQFVAPEVAEVEEVEEVVDDA